MRSGVAALCVCIVGDVSTVVVVMATSVLGLSAASEIVLAGTSVSIVVVEDASADCIVVAASVVNSVDALRCFTVTLALMISVSGAVVLLVKKSSRELFIEVSASQQYS